MTHGMSKVDAMAEVLSSHDIVHQSALQLWAAVQTDFDPFAVPPTERGPNIVPVRDVDIAIDTHLDLDARDALTTLEGHRLVVGRDAGTMSVDSIIPEIPPSSTGLESSPHVQLQATIRGGWR